MIKNRQRVVWFALLILISYQAVADGVKTQVIISIDEHFKSNNIVFTVENPTTHITETIGYYQAGQPLILYADANPIVNSRGRASSEYITACVSDNISFVQQLYKSTSRFRFSAHGTVRLSFPSMLV